MRPSADIRNPEAIPVAAWSAPMQRIDTTAGAVRLETSAAASGLALFLAAEGAGMVNKASNVPETRASLHRVMTESYYRPKLLDCAGVPAPPDAAALVAGGRSK